MNVLKGKVQSVPVLVFPDFDKPFLLETDASKEGLGAVLSQKQSNGRYHPVAFGSHSLTPLEKNYHSSKLEFLMLKWSVTEHFKEYLTYASFVVRTDKNLLTYVLTTPNLYATGHQWVGMWACRHRWDACLAAAPILACLVSGTSPGRARVICLLSLLA